MRKARYGDIWYRFDFKIYGLFLGQATFLMLLFLNHRSVILSYIPGNFVLKIGNRNLVIITVVPEN